MPPSGFTLQHVLPLETFLRSCLTDLQAQAEAAGSNPKEALDQEINQIDNAVTNDHFQHDSLETSVLELTRWFYSQIRNEDPRTFTEVDNISDSILDQVKTRLTSVNIENLNGSKAR